MRFRCKTSTKQMIFPMVLALLIGAGWSAPLLAQSTGAAVNRAGLVVVHEDGSVVSRCVGFAEESISGYELLVRGGFAPRSEVTSMGVSVCSVDGQGCGEGQDCFCQCRSSPCVYWTYWQHLPEGWRYSNVGAATVQVHDGDVQGWVWGESKPNAAAGNAPPALSFADICSAGATLYGVVGTEGASDNATNPLPGAGQTWMVTVIVGVPLLMGGAWWLWQQRKVAQP